MVQQDPFELLLSQFAEILAVLRQKKSGDLKDEISPEVKLRVENMQQLLHIFEDAAKQIQKDPETKGSKTSEQSVDPKTKRFLDRAQKMRDEIQTLSQEFANQLQEKSTRETGTTDQKNLKLRKKRIAKNMGFKGWQRL